MELDRLFSRECGKRDWAYSCRGSQVLSYLVPQWPCPTQVTVEGLQFVERGEQSRSIGRNKVRDHVA